MHAFLRLYRDERRTWLNLFRAMELAGCAALGRALFEATEIAAVVLS